MPEQHITSVGGQALIEGVMMQGPKGIATAVRKPDGEILTEYHEMKKLRDRYKYCRLYRVNDYGLQNAYVLGRGFGHGGS